MRSSHQPSLLLAALLGRRRPHTYSLHLHSHARTERTNSCCTKRENMAKSTSSLVSNCSSASTCSSSASSAVSSGASFRSTSSLLSAEHKLHLTIKSSGAIDRRKRLAANARERKRQSVLNKAYDELRKKLVDADNKSKYDVLVQAKEYILALTTICKRFDQQHQTQEQQEAAGEQTNETQVSDTQPQHFFHNQQQSDERTLDVKPTLRMLNSPVNMTLATPSDFTGQQQQQTNVVLENKMIPSTLYQFHLNSLHQQYT